MVVVRCPETGRWFEAFVSCARYKCCPKLIWIEKDFLMGGKIELDLTKDEPQV